jgi:hypothetical protein
VISTGVHYQLVAAANQFRLSGKSADVQPLGNVAPVEAFGQTNRAGAPKLLPFKPT